MRRWFSRFRLLVTFLFGLLISGVDVSGSRNTSSFPWPVALTVSAQAQADLGTLCVNNEGGEGCQKNLGASHNGTAGYWGGIGIYTSGVSTGLGGGGGGAGGSGGQSGGGQSQNQGGSGGTYVGDPINYAIGNAYNSETDYAAAGSFPLVLARHYNSQDTSPQNLGHLFGTWRGSYSRSITVSGDVAIVTRDDGQMLKFTLASWSTGAWTPPAYSSYRLSGGVSGSNFTLITDQDETEVYNASGKFLSYANRAGLTLTLSYDGLGRPTTVRDSFGRTLSFFYDTIFGLISRAQAPDGDIYAYEYDLLFRLTSVTYPDGSKRRFLYEDGLHWGALTGILDENDARYSSYAYDWYTGRAISTQLGAGANLFTVTYPFWPSDPVTVITPLGATKKFTLTSVDGLAKQTGEWRACSGCTPNGDAGQSDSDVYDSHGNVTSHTDFKGNRATYVYDQARNLPTSQTLAAGTSLARAITTTWHSNFRLPTQIVDGARTSSFTYDAKGNLLTSTVASGGSTSTSVYTYNSRGQVLTAKDPAGNVTSYAYDAMGNLTTVTNALGHVTAFANYDANGRPRKITDPNGVVTTLAYNFRGQITSRVTLSQTTTYTYDKAGQLTKVQEPSGVVLNYGYDAAHRLTSISDRFGNRIVYTLDAAGDRIKEEAFDPSGTLARTHRRAYDGFERLSQDIGATSQTSTFSYDANDNVVGAKDPNNNTTAFAYDALNRLTQKTEPQGFALTRYTYDALGRLASVTDPRNLVTSYANNWLDLPTTVTSPDAGATTKTYDAAGNVLTSKDARGQTTTYLYDDLNRRVKATHADGSVFTFVYDQGTNGKGRLTSLTDTTGTTSWTYDAFGHVLQKKQVTGAVTLTTSWSYDAATGRLTSMTYPSGYKLLYAYDAGARVSAISLQPPGGTAATLIGSISHRPFGPVASWDPSAAGGSYVRVFDKDGRISRITSSTGDSWTYAYDLGGRIASIAATGRPTKTYSYDKNDRLTEYHYGATGIGYAYDLSGNRTADSGHSYTIAPSSNRVTGILDAGSTATRPLSYDAAGDETMQTGAFSLAYDERNRLERATVGALVTNYSVNGLGQRVAKNGPAGQVEYYYDLAGHLLGSYGPAAAAREEIVWLGDLPIATLRGGATYFIAPDHLGAPRQIVNSANSQVWFWDPHPFGSGLRPTAAAGFSHDLRFPGQIYDAETGLHSNGHRDYDPRLGRYVESDPIGLEGGINTYAYAGNNPVNAIDPFGLDPKSEGDQEALPAIDIAGQVVEAQAASYVRTIINKLLNAVAKGSGNRTPSPALKGSPYHPDSVIGRVRPQYRSNPAHDPKSPLFNPRKSPEPADAASVYENSTRAEIGTWYGKGQEGWYRYFSDNAGGVHFSGTIPESQVPAAILRGQ